MGDEDAKRIILARRARFVAAALAGLNLAMCGGKSETDPQPCLSVVSDDDGGNPQPCLSPPGPGPVDAAVDVGDAGTDADDPDAQPQPCLSPLPPDSGDGG